MSGGYQPQPQPQPQSQGPLARASIGASFAQRERGQVLSQLSVVALAVPVAQACSFPMSLSA